MNFSTVKCESNIMIIRPERPERPGGQRGQRDQRGQETREARRPERPGEPGVDNDNIKITRYTRGNVSR